MWLDWRTGIDVVDARRRSPEAAQRYLRHWADTRPTEHSSCIAIPPDRTLRTALFITGASSVASLSHICVQLSADYAIARLLVRTAAVTKLFFQTTTHVIKYSCLVSRKSSRFVQPPRTHNSQKRKRKQTKRQKVTRLRIELQKD